MGKLKMQGKVKTEHVDNQTPEQVSTQVSGHLNTKVKHVSTKVSEHLDTQTLEHLDTLTRGHLPVFDLSLKPYDLNLNQYRILFELYFKRPFKVKGPDRIGVSEHFIIPYGTVRNCLRSLERKDYICKPFSINDGVTKGTTCQVNDSKCIPIFGHSGVINSEQVDNRTRGHLNTQTPEHLSPSNKLVSKYYNKLTDYLQKSKLWSSQGLSAKKCGEWIKEFYPDNPEGLLTQLMFAEKNQAVLNPKSKTSVDVFYGCLKKGGLTRPRDFEFPEEKLARKTKEILEKKQKALKDLKLLKRKEQECANELSFWEFLNDKEDVESTIEKIQRRNHITPRTKAAIQVFKAQNKIDSALTKVLRNEFQRMIP